VKYFLGFLTAVFLFFMLPVWYLIVGEWAAVRFSEIDRKKRDWGMFAGAVLILVISYVVWAYLLPSWWREATLGVMG
jgi:hypothetical protein